MKMDTSSQTTNVEYPWQATFPAIIREFRDTLVILKKNEQYQQPVRKKLTTEALVTLLVILSFVILTVIRMAISVYESCQTVGKETKASTVEKRKKAGDRASNAKKEEKSAEVSVSNLRKFLDCFHINSNARRLLNTVSTEEHLCALHGIRSVVLIWVLFGHISPFYGTSVRASKEFAEFLNIRETQILKNAIFIVDSFLVLSGFLNGYLFSQQYEKRNGKIPWFLFYVHRIVRISPLYFIVLAFYATVLPYLGSGPAWPTYETNPVCKDYWIWNVLFINNFVTHKQLCLLTSWYLGCEMQLYIISPIFLLLLIRKPKIGYIFSALVILGSSYINFYFTNYYQLPDGPTRLGEYYTADIFDFMARFWYYYDVLYSKPYARLGTYLIGLVLGCYLYGKKSKRYVKLKLVKLTLGWIISAIFMYIAIFALYGREESVWENAVYNGVKNTLFSCSLGWMIFVCVTGQGGFVNRFFSSKIFLIISRLSYSTFLIHIIILEGLTLQQKDLFDHSMLNVCLAFSLVLVIIPAAFVVSLILEAPIYNMTALLFKESNTEVKSSKRE